MQRHRHRRVRIPRPQRAAARAARSWDIVALYHRHRRARRVRRRHAAHARAPVALRSAECRRCAERRGGGGRTRRCRPVSRRQRRSGRCRRSIRVGISRANATALVNFLEHCPADHLVYRVVRRGLRRPDAVPVSPATPVSPRAAVRDLQARLPSSTSGSSPSAAARSAATSTSGSSAPTARTRPPRKITTRWLRGDGRRAARVHRPRRRPEPDRLHVRGRCGRRAFWRCCRRAASVATVDFASGAPVSVNERRRTRWRACSASTSTVRHEGTVPEYIEFRTVDHDDARSLRRSCRPLPSTTACGASPGVLSISRCSRDKQREQSHASWSSARARPASRRRGGCRSSAIRSPCSSATTPSAAWAGRSRRRRVRRRLRSAHVPHPRDRREPRGHRRDQAVLRRRPADPDARHARAAARQGLHLSARAAAGADRRQPAAVGAHRLRLPDGHAEDDVLAAEEGRLVRRVGRAQPRPHAVRPVLRHLLGARVGAADRRRSRRSRRSASRS